MRQTIEAALMGALLAGAPIAMSGEPAAVVINKACGPDLKQFCSNMTPGGQLAECIRENSSRFSPPCKEAIKAAQANKKE
jgi:hypothetical protein